MHGDMNVKLSQCTVTLTSNCHDARSHERQIVTMHGNMNVKFVFKGLNILTLFCTKFYPNRPKCEADLIFKLQRIVPLTVPIIHEAQYSHLHKSENL
jgi:hypothetical protein